MAFDFNLDLIISGGQTGVDRAALDFALRREIRCGGWCPAGRLAEDGVIDEKYPLKETFSSEVDERTTLNVTDSEATLILLFDYPPDSGTDFTIKQCRAQSRPYYVLQGKDTRELKAWLSEHKPTALNIAGPRESNAPGIYSRTIKFLENNLI